MTHFDCDLTVCAGQDMRNSGCLLLGYDTSGFIDIPWLHQFELVYRKPAAAIVKFNLPTCERTHTTMAPVSTAAAWVLPTTPALARHRAFAVLPQHARQPVLHLMQKYQ